VYLLKGMHKIALQDFNAAIRLGGDVRSTRTGRCLALALANRELERALADCNEALKLQPGDPIVLEAQGMVYYRMAWFQRAIEDFDLVLKGAPDFAVSLYLRGLAKRRLGRVEEGDLDVAAARRIEPTIEKSYAAFRSGTTEARP
jgi:tetratricopeptide (TPR) repeat protein